MVERIKNEFESYKSPEELVIEAKTEFEEEEELFKKIETLVNSCLLINGFDYKAFIIGLKELRKIKRYCGYFNKGNIEDSWDFFEMYDFISYIRKSYPEQINTLLKGYKGGKFNK
jgi:hypothetical protein